MIEMKIFGFDFEQKNKKVRINYHKEIKNLIKKRFGSNPDYYVHRYSFFLDKKNEETVDIVVDNYSNKIQKWIEVVGTKEPIIEELPFLSTGVMGWVRKLKKEAIKKGDVDFLVVSIGKIGSEAELELDELGIPYIDNLELSSLKNKNQILKFIQE